MTPGLLKEPGGRKKQVQARGKTPRSQSLFFAASALCARRFCGDRSLAANPLCGFLSLRNIAKNFRPSRSWLVLAQGCEKFGDWVVFRKENEACTQDFFAPALFQQPHACCLGIQERKHIAVKLPLDFAAFVPSAFSVVSAPSVLILVFLCAPPALFPLPPRPQPVTGCILRGPVFLVFP